MYQTVLLWDAYRKKLVSKLPLFQLMDDSLKEKRKRRKKKENHQTKMMTEQINVGAEEKDVEIADDTPEKSESVSSEQKQQDLLKVDEIQSVDDEVVEKEDEANDVNEIR